MTGMERVTELSKVPQQIHDILKDAQCTQKESLELLAFTIANIIAETEKEQRMKLLHHVRKMILLVLREF